MNQPTVAGNMIVPIVSEFERDDLLRLTSVRHWRDDSFGNTRLLGRYDYAYDENSMMKYEARWHEQDFAGGVPKASTTPDETDFYFYSSDNQLEKAIYNVTSDTASGVPLNLASLNWTNIDSNNVTATDRVIYGRRNLLPENDFKDGTRGRHSARYAEGTNVVMLEPDVALSFPDSATVNKALRLLLEIARKTARR